MTLLKSYSGRALILIFLVFTFVFSMKISKVVSNESTCVCSYDGFGYYMYLPHLFNEGSLYMTHEWAKGLQDEYCKGADTYQIVRYKNGSELNVYHMGMAFVSLPSYTIGDGFARLLGYPTDGFSKPYHIAFLLNTLFFIFLGLYYLRKLLLLFFDEKVTALTMLILFAASNIFITFKIQYDLQHLYLFAANAAFIFYTVKFTRTETKKHLWIAAIILGLTVFIRPTQALLGLIPLILFLKKYSFSKKFWKRIFLFPLIGIIWNIPQVIYWYTIGGEPFILNLHAEDIVLVDPNLIDFLFSYKKGWLLYSPIFIATFIGFYQLFKQNRHLFWITLSTIFIYIYVMSSWECWWYAGSFGSRVMVDIYALVAIPLGYFILSLNSTLKKVLGATFIIACTLLNSIQSYQLDVGYLHHTRMTKQHYWYIFGRLDIPNYTDRHLEIPRSASATGWVEAAKNLPPDMYEMDIEQIYTLKSPLTSESGKSLTIDRINILDLVPSDESMFDMTIVTKTSDSTKPVLLRMEIANPYNVYCWRSLEVSQGHTQGEFIEHNYKFNIEKIRHREDEMQMYLYTDQDVIMEIKSMTITAHSLIRK